jgi:hypothetical protein
MLARPAHASGEVPALPTPTFNPCLIQATPKLTVAIESFGKTVFVVKGSCLPANSQVTLNVWSAPNLSSFMIHTNAAGSFSISLPAKCGLPDSLFNVTYMKNGVSYSTPVVSKAAPAC